MNPGNPLDGSYSKADEFWGWASAAFASRPNVLYEIFNEPNSKFNLVSNRL